MDIQQMISKYKISLASLFVLIPSLFGAVSFVDSRYAQAEDITEVKTAQIQLQQNMDRRYTQMRHDQLEDSIFVLQMKKGQQGRLSPLDSALLDRYQSQLKSVKEDMKK